jgi:RNA polymerase sigma-70 factor (ECF subfamily)
MPGNQTPTTPAADAELIRQTLQGETSAFGELVRKYQGRLYNSVVRIVGSRVDAEDIVQEAFVRAFVSLRDFRRDCAFYTWLYRLALNLALTQIRKKEPAVSLDTSRELGFCEPVDTEESPEDCLMRKERAPAIAAALAKLNEQHRTILVLREIEQFDYATIARVLDLNVGTVRSRLHRARMRMRKLLYRSGVGQAVPDGNRLEPCETAIRQGQPDPQSC